MTIRAPELIEEYVLEIISRAQTIQERCKNLLSKEFATEAPKNLAKTIINICDYLDDATKSIFKSIDWTTSKKIDERLRILQTSDSIIRELGSHIRYVDGAQIRKLPWSFIKPFEKYVNDFLPDVEIMLRPQWKYNYTILVESLYEVYSIYLPRFEHYVCEKSLIDVLSPLGKSFYIISFPSLERKNILLHCLLGHEIGHLLSKEYFTKARQQELLQTISDKIAIITSTDIDKRLEAEPSMAHPLFIPLFKQEAAQAEIERANKAWQKGLEEILSDIIGSFLFGPAILFSTLEVALQDLNGLDNIPDAENNYYPPWRMRLRNILEVIKDLKLFPLPNDKFVSESIVEGVTKRFTLAEDIVRERSDEDTISKDPILKIAYEEISKDIIKAKELFKNKLKILNPSDLYRHISHLIGRIENGIPPNAYEKSINEREPAKIAEIINAVWFHKLSWGEHLYDDNGNFNGQMCEKRGRINRLALKALEYSDIEIEYIEKMGKPEEYKVDEQ